MALIIPLASWLRDISNMRDITNMKAVLSAPPSFLASLASTGLFKFKRIVGDPWKVIVEIDFKQPPKLSPDWVYDLPIYEDK